jgi:hypothetical protein
MMVHGLGARVVGTEITKVRLDVREGVKFRKEACGLAVQ